MYSKFKWNVLEISRFKEDLALELNANVAGMTVMIEEEYQKEYPNENLEISVTDIVDRDTISKGIALDAPNIVGREITDPLVRQIIEENLG